MSTMERILRLMQEKKASDLYLSANAPAQLRINGVVVPINSQLLPVDAPRGLLAEVVPAERIEELERTGELNMAISQSGVGRFRISGMRQRGSYAVVVRYIHSEIPELSTLNVPMTLADLVLRKRGLLLVVGATGSGKSTTLAAMLDHRNARQSGHILTVEEPIEFLFRNKKSKNALRQAPDVILIGEIRDRETMSAALSYAQTGHLCLATLHANNSYQALNRILNFYPVEVRPTMLGDLASALQGVVCQRLLRTVQGERVPAVEVLLNTRLVAEMIERGDFTGVQEAMEKSIAEGSQTFEAHIAQLITDGLVDRAEGLANADSSTNLLWRLQNSFARAAAAANAPADDADDKPTFTDITLDVRT
jgi:twitching motility protein PilU